MLVGTKKDLRTDEDTITKLAKFEQAPVSFEDGKAMARNMGAYGYRECSAQLNEGVMQVFEEVTRAAW